MKRIVITGFAYGRDINDEGFLCDVVKGSDGTIHLLRLRDDQVNGWEIGDDITEEVKKQNE